MGGSETTVNRLVAALLLEMLSGGMLIADMQIAFSFHQKKKTTSSRFSVLKFSPFLAFALFFVARLLSSVSWVLPTPSVVGNLTSS